jgi:ribonucleotide reductase alpha subunit
MSQKYFIHATPTLFNMGTQREQGSSCFLLWMNDDSIKGIYETLAECAEISKNAGGIGIGIHNIRGLGSSIKGTNGVSNGIAPMLRVYNSTAQYVDQCFHPNTYLYTSSGCKKISQIQEGDQIINSLGHLQSVNKVLEHSYKGRVYKIKTTLSNRPIIITPEHPIYSKLPNNKYEWNEVKKLYSGCEIYTPEIKYYEDIIYLSEDDCYFYGIYMAGGSTTKNHTHWKLNIYHKHAINFRDDLNNISYGDEQLNFVKTYLDKQLIQYKIVEKYNVDALIITSISWEKSVKFPFKLADFYHDTNDDLYKEINSKMLNLPINKTNKILEGFVKNYYNDRYDYQVINDWHESFCYLRLFNLYSLELQIKKDSNFIQSLLYLFAKNNIFQSNIYTNELINCNNNLKSKEYHSNSINETYQEDYNLEFKISNELIQILKLKNITRTNNFNSRLKIISKDTSKNIITSITYIDDYVGTLYDLEMDSVNEHNYFTEIGIAHNGGGKRKGSFAMYLEPWHIDIIDFLHLKRAQGSSDIRALDLFYGLWIPDLFMKRVEEEGDWTLMCPSECPDLYNTYGDKFEELYLKYEREGRGRKTIKAVDLWFMILESEIETGTPYHLYKDACNMKSNQKNLGTIKSSNLCTEIIEYTDSNETAVCNLASIGLPRFVEFDPETNKPRFNFEMLEEVTKVVTQNLNKIIDNNYYPSERAQRSNKKHRPIGIGVQGLADTYALFKYPFDSPEASELNILIFEHMYYASLEASMEIAKKRETQIKRLNQINEDKKKKKITSGGKSISDKIGDKNNKFDDNNNDLTNDNEKDNLKQLKNEYLSLNKERRELEKTLKLIPEEAELTEYIGAYSSFIGSPAHQGILQYDMWNHQPTPKNKERFDKLKEEIKKYGLRNSLLLAPMPTASTSQILGNNECFEPYTSVIGKRTTLAGEFIIVNTLLIKDLIELGIWNESLKEKIIENDGSIVGIPEIPLNLQRIYATAWDISQKSIIDQARDRGRYICQSQSMNLFVGEPSFKKLSSMHFYAWKQGLKTGQYYLRTKRKAIAQQFTIDPKKSSENNPVEECIMCSA